MLANKIKKLKTNQRIQHTTNYSSNQITATPNIQHLHRKQALSPHRREERGSISTQKRRKSTEIRKKTIRMTTIITACIKSQKNWKGILTNNTEITSARASVSASARTSTKQFHLRITDNIYKNKLNSQWIFKLNCMDKNIKSK